MNPALQFLELVDKNASNIFKEFIEKYSNSLKGKTTNIKKLTINNKNNNIKSKNYIKLLELYNNIKNTNITLFQKYITQIPY